MPRETAMRPVSGAARSSACRASTGATSSLPDRHIGRLDCLPLRRFLWECEQQDIVLKDPPIERRELLPPRRCEYGRFLAPQPLAGGLDGDLFPIPPVNLHAFEGDLAQGPFVVNRTAHIRALWLHVD